MTRQVENFSSCPERQPANNDNLCKDIYKPENRNQFCGTRKPENNCNTDDDFNNFFSNNLNNNIYDGGCVKPDYDNGKGLKNIDKGQRYLNKASTDLDQALAALENGNTRGARRELEEALKRSGKAVNQFDAAVEKHKGGGINGAYGEDGVRDGTREIKGSREDIKDALELLKRGDICEAKEAIRNAKRELNSGGNEVQAGEDALRGKKPVNTYRGREAASDREFAEGAREFNRTEAELKNALKELNSCDSAGALRDLEQAQRNLDQGQDNYKDGLRLNQTGDESLIKKGLQNSKTVDQSIDAAMDLIKCGCTREAKQMIEEALNRLERSQDQLTRGVERQDDVCDFRPPSNDGCNRGRDIDFPRDYRPTNPDFRDRINPGNGDRIGLFPGEFGIKLPLPPLPGRDFNPLDPIGLFDRGGKNGGFNPLDPAGVFSGDFNPLDPIGLFDQRGKNGGFNPLDPAGLFSNNDSGNSSPLDILNPVKGIKKIFKGLF